MRFITIMLIAAVMIATGGASPAAAAGKTTSLCASPPIPATAVKISCGAAWGGQVGAPAVAAEDVVISIEGEGIDPAMVERVIDLEGLNQGRLSDVIKNTVETHPLDLPDPGVRWFDFDGTVVNANGELAIVIPQEDVHADMADWVITTVAGTIGQLAGLAAAAICLGAFAPGAAAAGPAHGAGCGGVPSWQSLGVIAPGVQGVTGDRVRFADYDGDSRDDYLVVSDSGAVSAWRNTPGNNGIPSWSARGVFAAGVDGATRDKLRFADVNGDGRADYLMVSESSAVDAWLNRAGA
ncbi:FG-GAP repeat domain-containing protein [Streptosporangium sp. CA-115845]|uniref:FG-GAP repeat domain-containing protein n=1 Tax=Streptosporangium sp. CA-115845 TaxID=3240071 RepID=UPI003D89CFA9